MYQKGLKPGSKGLGLKTVLLSKERNVSVGRAKEYRAVRKQTKQIHYVAFSVRGCEA